MTAPIVSSQDLRPLITLIFRKRFRIVGLFLIVTVGLFTYLKVIKFAEYESSAIVMVKTPLIDFDARIDPNPQIAPVYFDLAMSGGLLADTHKLLLEMRELAEPIGNEFGIESRVRPDERSGWLAKMRGTVDFEKRLEEIASLLPLDWQREIFRDPEMFLGLFELHPKDLGPIDLGKMQESFSVRSGIAVQTNVSVVNEPFINMKVSWRSPGSAALWANLWARIFVDRVNDLTVETGEGTEESIVTEGAKLEHELQLLNQTLTEESSQPEYQKMREVRAIENALYGGEAKFHLFGYVDLHGEISTQSGLVGKLGELRLKHAEAVAEASALLSMAEGSEEAKRAQIQAASLETQVAESERQIEEMATRARTLRGEIADFQSSYKQTEFQIEQGTRIFAERLTTSVFSRSRLKAGYAIPPMVFVERAVPNKLPAGPKKSVLSLAAGFFAALLYLCWVVYRGYVVPSVEAQRKPTA